MEQRRPQVVALPSSFASFGATRPFCHRVGGGIIFPRLFCRRMALLSSHYGMWGRCYQVLLRGLFLLSSASIATKTCNTRPSSMSGTYRLTPRMLPIVFYVRFADQVIPQGSIGLFRLGRLPLVSLPSNILDTWQISFSQFLVEPLYRGANCVI